MVGRSRFVNWRRDVIHSIWIVHSFTASHVITCVISGWTDGSAHREVVAEWAIRLLCFLNQCSVFETSWTFGAAGSLDACIVQRQVSSRNLIVKARGVLRAEHAELKVFTWDRWLVPDDIYRSFRINIVIKPVQAIVVLGRIGRMKEYVRTFLIACRIIIPPQWPPQKPKFFPSCCVTKAALLNGQQVKLIE